jgi:hypothetical protein
MIFCPYCKSYPEYQKKEDGSVFNSYCLCISENNLYFKYKKSSTYHLPEYLGVNILLVDNKIISTEFHFRNDKDYWLEILDELHDSNFQCFLHSTSQSFLKKININLAYHIINDDSKLKILLMLE